MRKLWLAKIVLISATAMATGHAQTYKVLYHFGSKSGDPLRPQRALAGLGMYSESPPKEQ
jgi:hypothetical protein